MKSPLLNCKQVVTIVSTDDTHSWRRNLMVRFHLLICVHCRKYVQQIKLLRMAFVKLFNSAPTESEKTKIKQLEDAAIAKIQVDRQE